MKQWGKNSLLEVTLMVLGICNSKQFTTVDCRNKNQVSILAKLSVPLIKVYIALRLWPQECAVGDPSLITKIRLALSISQEAMLTGHPR